MPYDVAQIRKRLRASQSGKFVDPDEFRPEKAQSAQDALKYRFFILPPLMVGDKIAKGEVKEGQGMEQFFISHANHWVNKKPYPCPRIWDGSDCPICQQGFDLLKDEQVEEKRKAILSTWMANTNYVVNIYFPNIKLNPEELRGKVKYYKAPKTCLDSWSAALMREDAGDDPEDLQAYGVFFDENAAFAYQLQVLKNGRDNSYKTSKFVANGGVPRPIVEDANGNADAKAIAKILASRHNLFEKLEMPDHEKIAQIYRVMIDGDDEPAEGGGFDSDEEEASKPVASKLASSVSKASAQGTVKVTKPTKPAKSEDDDLLEEAPLESVSEAEEEAPPAKPATPAKAAKPATKAPAKAPEPEAAPPADDDGDDEIDQLLQQLDDENDE